ncbi:hypothetical protein QAD02_006739 [Eretmocerus hayati]|uniref:Uncharacterized protein n=1 Tax=Eretmocerus hayati TaxID=131215 RepID=A0ACC2N224_9HYME|nr:hypothetical protein QAD02_006739 [Eretmocerus hayati]
MDVRIIGTKLYIDGFLYGKNIDKHGKIYWRCRRNHELKCPARAITSDPSKKKKLVVYKGPKESEHNHGTISWEIEAVEKMADIVQRRVESQMHGVALSPSNSDTEIEPKSKSSCSTFEKTEKMGINTAGWTRSDEVHLALSLSVPGSSREYKTEKEVRSVRLIGKRLCIDNFIYTKQENRTELSWVCRRYRTSNCPARAITSDPSGGEKLIVYKGPNESKHNHKASLAEIKEAELAAKFPRTSGRKPKLKDEIQIPSKPNSEAKKVQQARQQDYEPDVRSYVVTKMEGIESESNSESKQPIRLTVRKKIYLYDSDQNHDSSPPRLIGKRIYIDGYMYVSKSYDDRRINWECRRYRTSTGECPAKARTSNPLNGAKLIVFRGPEDSHHNHPPDPAEVKESEDLAAYEPKKSKNKSKASESSDQNLIGEKNDVMNVKDELNCTDAAKKKEKLLLTGRFKKAKGCGRRVLLSDPTIYREFLLQFSKRPKFKKKYITRALKPLYKSKRAQLMAHSNILENQLKVAQDLDALNNDPNAFITALNCNNSPLDGEDHLMNETVVKEEFDERISENCIVKMEPDPETFESQGNEILDEENDTETKITEILPTSPNMSEGTCTKNHSSSNSPLPFMTNVTGFEIKKEVHLMDVTDYFVIKQESEASEDLRVIYL